MWLGKRKLPCSINYLCRNSRDSCPTWHVGNNDCICANNGVSPYHDGPEDFRSSPNVDVSGNFGNTSLLATSNGDLLKDQAIHADPSSRMDDDSIWMRDQQATTNAA